MPHIVVYDKKSAGSPIVGIHSAPPGQEHVELQDIHPGADPTRYGAVLVPDDVIAQMTARQYKRDRKGKVVTQSVLEERTKDLVAAADSALGENILVFGEPYAEIKSVTDLNGRKARHTAKNPAKGIIGVGTRSGFFTVTCNVDTSVQAPAMLAEEKNWEWERDSDENIIGIRLLKKLPLDSEQ
jgi:hypothetical protein